MARNEVRFQKGLSAANLDEFQGTAAKALAQIAFNRRLDSATTTPRLGYASARPPSTTCNFAEDSA